MGVRYIYFYYFFLCNYTVFVVCEEIFGNRRVGFRFKFLVSLGDIWFVFTVVIVWGVCFSVTFKRVFI